MLLPPLSLISFDSKDQIFFVFFPFFFMLTMHRRSPLADMFISFLFIIIIFIITLLIWEFFYAAALADSFSLEFEWKQVSSSLQESSQYSGQSRQCFNLDGLNSSSSFQVLQSLYQSFGDCTECTNYIWYHRHFHVPVTANWLKSQNGTLFRTCEDGAG